MKGYQLKITIKGSKPPIWRRVVVPDQITFYQLHQVIQEAFGWWDDHLHKFEFKKLGLLIRGSDHEDLKEMCTGESMEEDVLIDELITENPRFAYTYDLGDTWEHQILFEKDVEYEYRYPQVLKYKGDNIPEDCGGIDGYYSLLEQRSDPGPEKCQAVEDRAGQQGIAEYDLEAVNGSMKEKLEFVQFETVSTMEDMFSHYDKSELLRIAGVHRLKGCDGLGKGKLVSHLSAALLEPERMERYLSSMSDAAAAEFGKAAAHKGVEYRGDLDSLSFLHRGGYCGFTGRGAAVVAKDVAKAYGVMNTDGFQNRRRRCYMVWSCIKAAVYLYGAADAGRVEAVLGTMGSDVKPEEIIPLYEEMKDIWTGIAYKNNLFIEWELVERDAYKKVLRYQQGRKCYIPTPAQIKEIAELGAADIKKQIRPLKAFLLSMVGCDEKTADRAAVSIHHYVRLGGTPKGVEEIMEHYDLTLDSQEKMDGFDGIMEQVWKSTRTVGNCGHTRTEMDAITAHVAPNAPCPCGSGKRYRQCCGRK